MMVKSILTVVAIFLGLYATAQNTYYVSTTGNNSSNGLSATSPFLTIQYAINTAADNDSIILLQGTYIENVMCGKTLHFKGQAGFSNTIWKHADNQQFLLTAFHPNWDNSNMKSPTLTGITFTKNSLLGANANYNGFRAQQAAKIVFNSCWFEDLTNSFSTYYGFFTVNNSVFYNVQHIAINDAGYAEVDRRPTFNHVTIINSNALVHGQPYIIPVFNNCLISKTVNQTSTYFQNIQPIFNKVYIDQSVNAEQSSQYSVISDIENFGFVDYMSKNFRLKNASGAIGSGIVVPGINIDILGSARPSLLPDLGAYENLYSYPTAILTNIQGGNGSLIINWTNNNASIAEYQIFRSTSSIPDTTTTGAISSNLLATALSYNDNSVVNLTTYYYRIRVKNTAGIWSGLSNEIYGTPNVPPSTPTLITAQNGPYRSKLTWSPASSLNSTLTYKVYRGSTANNLNLISTNVTDTFFVDVNLLPTQSYFYALKSVDQFGVESNFSNVLEVIPDRIWYVSTTGANNQNKGFVNDGFLTVQYAINAAQNNDTIILNSGIYTNAFDFSNKSLTIGSTYLLNGDTTQITSTIIDGSSFGGNNAMIVCNSFTNSFKFEGLTVRNTIAPAFYIQNRGNSLIKNCIFQNNGNYSLWATMTVQGNVKIEDCIFRNNKGRYVLQIGETAPLQMPVLQSNLFRGNGNPALVNQDCDHGVIFCETRGIISNNIFLNNNTPCIALGANAFDTVNIYNNTIYNNSNIGIFFYNWGGGGFFNVSNNLIKGNHKSIEYHNSAYAIVNLRHNSFDLINNATTPSVNNFEVNTINNLVNPNIELAFETWKGYQIPKLSNQSPLIGQGYAVVGNNLDFFKNSRPLPSGSTVDIGAIENSLGQPQILLTDSISVCANDTLINLMNYVQPQTGVFSGVGDRSMPDRSPAFSPLLFAPHWAVDGQDRQ